MTPKEKEPCRICVQIRYFLMIAIPLIVLISTQAELELPEFPIESAFANLIGILFVVVIAFRVYTDYFKKKK